MSISLTGVKNKETGNETHAGNAIRSYARPRLHTNSVGDIF